MLKYQAFFVCRYINLDYDKRVIHFKYVNANATFADSRKQFD